MASVQGAPRTTRLGADGNWLGALKRGTYFSASVDPGERHLCARVDILLVGIFTGLMYEVYLIHTSAFHRTNAEFGKHWSLSALA